MIRVFSKQETAYNCTWTEFSNWLKLQQEVQFDIETNVTQYWCTKSVKFLQFGHMTEDVQYVLEYTAMNAFQLQELKDYLESWKTLKVGHRLSFEYVVLRFHGIEIHNLHCTLVAEKILTGGLEVVDYGLSDLTLKYCGISLDKTLQTAFGDGVLTEEKIQYAANDVKYLGTIVRAQRAAIKKMDMDNILWLEMRALLAFSDCTYYGIDIDEQAWLNNVDQAEPLIKEAKERLDQWVLNDRRLLDRAEFLGFYSSTDKVKINFKSIPQRTKALQYIFPDIEGSSKGILDSWVLNKGEALGPEKLFILVSARDKAYEPLTNYLLEHFRNEMIQEGWLKPAGHVELNWNSRDQALNLLKAVEPKLKDLSEESVNKTSHPVFLDLTEYKDYLKLTGSYGTEFLKHVEPDGKIRTNFNPIVRTGRSSSAKPNMQQVPAKEKLNNRYRSCFYYKGKVLVDSDFTGQELALIAYASNDDVWKTAIIRGEDLHSKTAAMVFGKVWAAGTLPDCAFAAKQQKCKCPKHVTLRNSIKTINFGLAYGMSQYKLAATQHSTVKEAEKLIEQYFNTFPQIKKTLQNFGRFAVLNGYTQTLAPFHRKRVFPEWDSSRVQYYLRGIEKDARLARIERQGKNTPIQGSGADLMKLAMWVVYKYIRDNNLTDKVHILLQVHDQLVTACEDTDYKNQWCATLDKLMCDAAKVIVKDGFLKADTHISERWKK